MSQKKIDKLNFCHCSISIFAFHLSELSYMNCVFGLNSKPMALLVKIVTSILVRFASHPIYWSSLSWSIWFGCRRSRTKCILREIRSWPRWGGFQKSFFFSLIFNERIVVEENIFVIVLSQILTMLTSTNRVDKHIFPQFICTF